VLPSEVVKRKPTVGDKTFLLHYYVEKQNRENERYKAMFGGKK